MTYSRSTAAVAFVALTVSFGATDVRAQSIADQTTGGSALPPNDTVVRTDLHSHYEALANQAGGPAAGSRPWEITPELDLAETLTDNANVGYTGKPQWDLITQFTPSVSISGDTVRLKGNLSYSPSFNVYARDSKLDSVAQNLNGHATATFIPETLFLDLGAFAGLQSVTGGVSDQAIGSQNRQNQNQNYSFYAEPYVQHRFGGYGLGELGYKVSYSSSNAVSGLSGQNVTANTISPQLASLNNQINTNVNNSNNVVTQTEHAAFNTGENLGRISLRGLASSTQYSGGGLYTGARNNYGTVDAAYALNHLVAALTEIGYEDIAYSGIPPVKIDDVIWAAGTKLTLGPDKSITATYGHRFGRPNVFVDAVYAPTARLKLYGRYSQSLTTNLEDIQNTLSQVDVDSAGGLFDRTTGAPVAVLDDFLGVQSGVFRLSRASLSAVLLYTNDTFSFVLSDEIRKLISAAPGTTLQQGSTRGYYGTITWNHTIRPDLSTNLYVQYGRSNNGAFLTNTSDQDSYTASASVNYALSPTLSARGVYTYQKSADLYPGQTSAQNLLLVGLHKRF